MFNSYLFFKLKLTCNVNFKLNCFTMLSTFGPLFVLTKLIYAYINEQWRISRFSAMRLQVRRHIN